MTAAQVAALLFVSALAGCGVRELPAPVATCADVEPLLLAKCASCHGAERAEAGYRVDSCIATIACPTDAASAVAPPDTSAPILAVLARPAPDPHVGLLTTVETALLREWVETGSPLRSGGMHAAGWADPRSPAFHGTALRAERFAPMLRPTDDALVPAWRAGGACARCHAGTDGNIDPNQVPAAGATACTNCHRDPGGPTACTTCHGSAGHAYPTRDLCLHPEDATTHPAGAHAKHVGMGLTCANCHGERTIAQLSDPTSEHNNDQVDVHLDPSLSVAGGTATYDSSAHTCSETRCHTTRSSTRPPNWLTDVGLINCGSCHQSPPDDHYAGMCNTCHVEASADGLSRTPGPLHANGVVDIGDGSGTCHACHGSGVDGMPASGSHASHVNSELSAPIDCSNCHVKPTEPLRPGATMGHLDLLADGVTPADVIFPAGGLASARGAVPVRDAATNTCSQIACHGVGLGGGSYTEPQLWGDTRGVAARCGACHSIPPPPPHTQSTSCSTVGCHGGYIVAGTTTLSPDGVAVHTNGTVNLWTAP